MIVKDMLLKLQQMPQDTKVGIVYDGALRASADFVYLSKKGKVAIASYGESGIYDEDMPLNTTGDSLPMPEDHNDDIDEFNCPCEVCQNIFFD